MTLVSVETKLGGSTSLVQHSSQFDIVYISIY